MMREIVRFWVQAPPKQLTANARTSWGAKHRIGREYAEEAGQAILAQIPPAIMAARPFTGGRLSSIHFFSRQVGDADNCIATLKPIIDILKVATKATGKRYCLGLIDDDRRLEVASPGRQGNDGREAGRIMIQLELWK